MNKKTPFKTTLDGLCINTIRTLSIDAIQRANSGHPGTPMAMAPLVYLLYDRFLNFNPRNPEWPNRDRFILSAGHASMLLYSTLHITGYGVSLEDIRHFRKLHSRCPGHPEYGITPGVETTTGPLGQGVANSVGFAIAEKWLRRYFNRPEFPIIDYQIFALAGDGCMMEGISGEAASLAGHLGLNNLIWLYDNNHITIEGNTDLTFSEDVATRFMGYHWNVQRVGDANDLERLSRALQGAINEADRPSLIIVDSHIAYGSPNKQDTSGAHGAPLGEEEVRATKRNYGWDPDKQFYLPPEVQEYQQLSIQRGIRREREWKKLFSAYQQRYPELAAEFSLIQGGKMPAGWDCCLPEFPAEEKGIAGRNANHQVLNAIAEKIPWFMGGAADLAPSTKTLIEGDGSFTKDNHSGRNFHFGIREHAMGAILNGMALSKLKVYGAGFLIFSDYMRAPVRLSALMNQPVIYIFTHDSIGVGEDGPTHQPIEHLASLRAIPRVEVIRPADANELSVLWKYIMEVDDHPMVLVLSRQNLPTIDRQKYAPASGALRGAYVLADSTGTPDVILMATGSEVQLCLKAHEQLQREGYSPRVVSMPSWSLYESQDPGYWEEVLPASVTARVAVEAGSTFGWRRYAGTHDRGTAVGLRNFGASAPITDLLQEFGLTVNHVVQAAIETIEKNRMRQ